MKELVLIVGAGPIAVEYSKILSKMTIPYHVVGRGEASAKQFEQVLTGVVVHRGGLNNYLKHTPHTYTHAIVCVSEIFLGSATRDLVAHGVKNILVEKPGAANFNEIGTIVEIAQNANAKIYVGYNRRFYSSVIELQKRIKNDGGLQSFSFEFTEWSHVIGPLQKEDGVKEEWFLHNSSHVIDLAFYLGGKPAQMFPFVAGKISWHPKGSTFAGAGKTTNNALFTYTANWESAGRWGAEFNTLKGKYILRPLEKLQFQQTGTILVTEIALEDTDDMSFKPGFFKQTELFFKDPQRLLTIEEQFLNCKNYYSRILIGE